MTLFENLPSCQYVDFSSSNAPDTRLHYCWVIHGRISEHKKSFSTYVTKVIRSDAEGDKELYAEMTSEEELTYKSALALDSEYFLLLHFITFLELGQD